MFSDACLIATDYGREKIIRDDWKSIFDDKELADGTRIGFGEVTGRILAATEGER